MIGDLFGRTSSARQPYEEVVCTLLAVGFAAFSNFYTRRPLFSRLYLYPIYGSLGYVAGRVMHDVNNKRIADRELAIWDYVRRHPEDFPEIKPKKYKEVLESWVPIR